MFLTETSQQGTYTPTTGDSAGIAEPLYVTQTANLGNARYEGVEFQFEDAPLHGFGYKVQGSLQRAFVYDLAPRSTARRRDRTRRTSASSRTSIFRPAATASMRFPPAAFRTAKAMRNSTSAASAGSLVLARLHVQGPNNAFNQPAFGVFSASARVAFSKNAWLQVSGDNLTGVYAQPYADLLGGVPVALINGKLGVVAGSNVGPTTLQVTVHESLR